MIVDKQTNSLAELVLLKTGGNPFFLQEFLKSLEEALLHYNRHSLTYAARLFEEVLRLNPEDRAAQIYLERCQGIKPMDINSYELDKFVQFQNTNHTVDDEVAVFSP